jgi:hypothetical protein
MGTIAPGMQNDPTSHYLVDLLDRHMVDRCLFACQADNEVIFFCIVRSFVVFAKRFATGGDAG